MTQDTESVQTRPEPPPLKVPELPVNEKEPWSDDVLEREQVAARLTNIVRGQEAPFVISVDGRWGTGKTFLLKRWAQDLRKQEPEWRAIYYNAWEDDFADDPLLAIIGQISEHFAKGRFRRYLPLLGKFVAPLLRQGASIALASTTGVVLPPIPAPEEGEPPQGALSNYHQRRETKESLRRVLESMSERVAKETGQPLVFIIDELDRCRPTFAIELLERVKHIFDVPNIVFVFGINRGELLKSLESVYGDIEAGEYLRRFFDFEFVLPDADPRKYCEHLVAKFGLRAFFAEVDQRRQSPHYVEELRDIARFLPVVLGGMGLSLRDMDYCVRLVALAGRESLANQRLYAPLLVLLAATKVRDPELYRRFVDGDARGADLINHLNGQRPLGDPTAQMDATPGSILNWLEAATYYADDRDRSLRQLRRLENGEALDQPEYVSSELADLDVRSEENLRRVRDIIHTMSEGQRFLEGYGLARQSLAEKIDIYAGLLRR